ncbi:ATP-binding cassette domain-containing protein [uncultured Roseovarius sp.]|uniref:ATP-binding cassette domain-containing protein n=1 Tax=uncultured Roseovarius sp. TaxID=293344 RepID=UPI0026145861|nr:ATP-binding cassette domain-containing protein [uncultured Roseovarius sp.]
MLDVQALGVRLSDEFGVVVDRLKLHRGEVIVLDAPSGAGKSTVLGLISGAIAPDRSAKMVHMMSHQQIANRAPGPETMGFVLQTSALVPYLSVEENITLPCQVAQIAADSDWLSYLINGLGLQGLETRKPQQISVGQRQRVGIARSFLAKPALLLLDEPVSALDPSNVDQVESLIALLAEEAGAGVVLASHQAARGAFSGSPRAHHRTEVRGGTLYSVFDAELAA